MKGTPVVVEGVLKPDGTLELDTKLNLPPGRVRVILQTASEQDDVWQVLDRIRERRRRRGAARRTRQEIDESLRTMREEWNSPLTGANSS